jgi:hypothetical protein
MLPTIALLVSWCSARSPRVPVGSVHRSPRGYRFFRFESFNGRIPAPPQARRQSPRPGRSWNLGPFIVGDLARGVIGGGYVETLSQSAPARHRCLTAQTVALIVKAAARRAGLDPQQFSAHSLRAGWITSAAKRRAPINKIMDVSRHRSVDSVLGYVRDAELYGDTWREINAAEVMMNAAVWDEEKYKKTFPQLPPMPSAAFRPRE